MRRSAVAAPTGARQIAPDAPSNTGLVTLLTIGIRTPWPAACAVLVLIGVRVCFFLRALVLSAELHEAGRAAPSQ